MRSPFPILSDVESIDDLGRLRVAPVEIAGKQLSKAEKARIAKHVCALANTYGGFVVLHGKGKPLAPLRGKFFKRVDTVVDLLNKTLEPSLNGLTARVHDKRIVISVPESSTKPHRTSVGPKNKRQYYYRRRGKTVPMEELLVSSLYRNQIPLRFDVVSNIERAGAGLTMSITIMNTSMLMGTMPHVTYEVLHQSADLRSPRAMTSGLGLAKGGGLLSMWEQNKDESAALRLSYDAGRTEKSFRNELLYPGSSLRVVVPSSDASLLTSPHLLLRTTAYLAEAPAVSELALIDLDNPVSIVRGSDQDLARLFSKFTDRVSRSPKQLLP